MRIITLLLVIASVVLADDISIINPTASGPMTFAAKKLEQILATQGHNVVTKYSSASNRGRTIEFSVDASLRLKPESYALSATDSLIRITGVDAKGAMYGALGLAEDFRNGLTWAQINNREEEPQLAFRAIKFNLPWDSYRKSEALSLHMDTVRDLKFWQKFLDMMAENRFNVLSLWNLHPFMYMVQPAGYPEVQEFTPAEMAEWQKFYHTLFAMCAERGIETYIVFWNIFVPPTFAKAHGVALDNLDHHFFGKADTSEIVKQYTHDVIKQTLEEYPNLTGIGFGLGEMMGGMTPTEREQWALDVIIPGVQSADRPAKLIHRVPFSANRGSGGSMNFATEKMTRHALDTIEGMDGPIWVEIKFNWSHAHSTPKLVKVHGGAIKDSYWNPMPKNYKITWMARNEDFFCLRWGEPDFIREHIRLNSKPYVGGYFVGSECYSVTFRLKTFSPNWMRRLIGNTLLSASGFFTKNGAVCSITPKQQTMYSSMNLSAALVMTVVDCSRPTSWPVACPCVWPRFRTWPGILPSIPKAFSPFGTARRVLSTSTVSSTIRRSIPIFCQSKSMSISG